MRHPLRWTIWSAVLLLVLGSTLLLYLNATHNSELEQWVGSQVAELINQRLNPQVRFEKVSYEYPGTVVLKNLRLTAEDPQHSNQTIDIITCEKATLTLADVPRAHQPIVIQTIALDHPVVSLIAASADRPSLIGFADFVRKTSRPSTTQQKKQFSDLLEIRLVQISDGKIIYDSRQPAGATMMLDGINTELAFKPSDAGWYRLSAALARKPLFDLSLSGQLSLDTLAARDVSVKLRAHVDDDNVAFMPPPLQRLISTYAVRGFLSAEAAGALPLNHPNLIKAQFASTLHHANFTFGDFHIPAERFAIAGELADQALQLSQAQFEGLDGTLAVTGGVKLNGDLDSDLKLKISGIRVEEFLATRQADVKSKYAGRFDADAWLRGPLRQILQHAAGKFSAPLPPSWGSAIVTLSEAHVVELPVFHDFLSAMGAVDGPATARANAAIDFGRDIASVNDFRYVGRVIAAHGRGTIGLDREMNLLVNAGPIEKTEAVLGSMIGGTIGRVTDQIVSYRVTGLLPHPQVHVEFIGGVNKFGKALGSIGQDLQELIRPNP